MQLILIYIVNKTIKDVFKSSKIFLGMQDLRKFVINIFGQQKGIYVQYGK